jgi:hypothetical protein
MNALTSELIYYFLYDTKKFYKSVDLAKELSLPLLEKKFKMNRLIHGAPCLHEALCDCQVVYHHLLDLIPMSLQQEADKNMRKYGFNFKPFVAKNGKHIEG